MKYHLNTPILLKRKCNILPSPIVPINSRKHFDNNYLALGLNYNHNFMNEDIPFSRIHKKLKLEHSILKINPVMPQPFSQSKNLQRKMTFETQKSEKLFSLNTNIYRSPSKRRIESPSK